MRVLIDGLDLSGKSTLAASLAEALLAAGLPVRRSVGGLHKGMADRVAGWLYRRLPPGSALVSWAFALALWADRRARPEAAVVVHEAHAAHAIAFAEGFGQRLPAALLRRLRPRLPRFDLVIYLGARPLTRYRRYLGRPRNDAVDAALLADPARLERIDARLASLLAEDGAWRIDTDELDADEILERVLLLVGARLGRAA